MTGSDEWSDTIQVLVGLGETSFIAHRSFLIKAPFFEACLRLPMEEASTKVVRLPQYGPDAFAAILQFLYFDSLLEPVSETVKGLEDKCEVTLSTADVSMGRSIERYVQAKKLGMTSMMDALVTDIKKAQKAMAGRVTYAEFDYVFNYSEDGDSLRQACLQMIGSKISAAGWKGWKGWKVTHSDIYESCLKDNSGNIELLFEASQAPAEVGPGPSPANITTAPEVQNTPARPLCSQSWMESWISGVSRDIPGSTSLATWK